MIGTHAESTLPYVRLQDSKVTTDDLTYSRTSFPAREPETELSYFALPANLPKEFSGAWNYSVFPTHLFGVTPDFVVWEKVSATGPGKIDLELILLGLPELKESKDFGLKLDNLLQSIRDVEQEDQNIMNAVGEGLRSRFASSSPFGWFEQGVRRQII